jgi:hypothetical protein
MPTPPEVMSAHAQNPGGLAAPVAGGVADDLHAIFPHAPPRAGTSQMRFGLREVGRKRSPKRVAAAGAMIAAALGGLSAGAMLGRSPSTEIHRPKPASAPMTAQRQIAITVTGKSQLTSAVAPEGLPNPGPLAPPQLVRASIGPQTHAPVVKVKTRAKAPRSSRAQNRSYASQAPTSPAPKARCRGGECGYDDVMAADARLRRAYNSALSSGVSLPVMVGYRNEWSDLRKRASDQPERVVSRYNAMAGDLERYSEEPAPERPHKAHATRVRSHTLDGLRADLASLWP